MKDLPLGKVISSPSLGRLSCAPPRRGGRADIMTTSWHMMVDFDPPLIVCVVSEADYSFAALRTTKECVIAIPAVGLAEEVVKVGNTSDRDIDKFAAFGLTTARPSS